MRKRTAYFFSATSLFCLLALLPGCGNSIACSGNVAIVSGHAISQARYRQLLRYTLNFYEHVDQQSKYYRHAICKGSATSSACKAVKTQLRQHMVDEQVVATYAQHHHLTPTSRDWSRAMDQERQLIQRSGGYTGFSNYLSEVGMTHNQFVSIVGDQIETAKVKSTIGSELKFQAWLRGQEKSAAVKLCHVPGT